MKYIITQSNIRSIRPGDTVLHNDALMTVGKNDITHNRFLGLCLFGDCYKIGYKPVQLVTFITAKKR